MTSLERAILGLLAMQPGTGYDLMRTFESTSMGRFGGSPGAIYPALARLEDRGVVKSSAHTGSGRVRHVYRVTREGHEALQAWLDEPITREDVRDHLDLILLRFSVAETLFEPGESTSMLTELRGAVEAELKEVLREKDGLDTAPYENPLLALQHGVMSLRCTLDWIDWAIERLSSRDLAAETADLERAR